MGMKREEDPPTLGFARPLKRRGTIAIFARNVVRAVRAEIPERDGLSGLVQPPQAGRRQLSAAAAVAIAAFTFQVLQHQGSPHRGLTTAEVQDSDVAADLDLWRATMTTMTRRFSELRSRESETQSSILSASDACALSKLPFAAQVSEPVFLGVRDHLDPNELGS